MILQTLKSYFKLILRWLLVLGFGYVLYWYFVYNHSLQIIQFIAVLGVLIALLKDLLLDLLLPPIFLITTSGSKPHFHEFPVGENNINQSWLAVEIKNIGLSSARNVQVYFYGIESNIINDFDAYLSLPIRKAFGEVPKDKDPTPRPVLIPRKARFFFSFCWIQNLEQGYIHFDFPRTPRALAKVNCTVKENSFFKFEILLTTDTRFIINNKSKFKFSYNGHYAHGFRLE